MFVYCVKTTQLASYEATKPDFSFYVCVVLSLGLLLIVCCHCVGFSFFRHCAKWYGWKQRLWNDLLLMLNGSEPLTRSISPAELLILSFWLHWQLHRLIESRVVCPKGSLAGWLVHSLAWITGGTGDKSQYLEWGDASANCPPQICQKYRSENIKTRLFQAKKIFLHRGLSLLPRSRSSPPPNQTFWIRLCVPQNSELQRDLHLCMDDDGLVHLLA